MIEFETIDSSGGEEKIEKENKIKNFNFINIDEIVDFNKLFKKNCKF